MTLPDLLKSTVELGGSDLHLTTNTPPQVRVHGRLQRLAGTDLTPSETKQLSYSVLTDAQKKRFEETLELDFSFGVKNLGRFRCNLFNQRGAVGAVYRLIPDKIRGFDELNLPRCWRTRPRAARPGAGTGRPGPESRRRWRDDRQDQQGAPRPHPDLRIRSSSCTSIRAVWSPARVHSGHAEFSMALRAALREDPDIVLIADARSRDVEAALRTPKPATCRSARCTPNSAAQTINRITTSSPPSQQAQIRTQLSLVAEGVLPGAAAEESAAARRRVGDPGPPPPASVTDPRGQGPSDLLGDADRPGKDGMQT